MHGAHTPVQIYQQWLVSELVVVPKISAKILAWKRNRYKWGQDDSMSIYNWMFQLQWSSLSYKCPSGELTINSTCLKMDRKGFLVVGVVTGCTDLTATSVHLCTLDTVTPCAAIILVFFHEDFIVYFLFWSTNFVKAASGFPALLLYLSLRFYFMPFFFLFSLPASSTSQSFYVACFSTHCNPTRRTVSHCSGMFRWYIQWESA